MTTANRTDRALQEFLDSLAQVPGSIIYRDTNLWRGLGPGSPGQVLALNEQAKPAWIPPPGGSAEPIAALLPVHWFDCKQETRTDGETITTLTDRGAIPVDMYNRYGAPTWNAAKGAIHMDGIDDALFPSDSNQPLLAQPSTTIIVADVFRDAGGGYLVGGNQYIGSGDRTIVSYQADPDGTLAIYAGTGQYAFPGVGLDQAIIVARFDRTNSAIWLNGVKVNTGDPGSNGAGGMAIGSSYHYLSSSLGKFDLYELARLGYGISDQQAADLTEQLASKWAITL